MLKDFLDKDVYDSIINAFSFDNINEIRMRLGEKIIVCVKNKKYFLKNQKNEYVYCTKFVLDKFIKQISENSIYAFNDNIINGFITLSNGIRVGLCGNVVVENNKIVTIKDFQAVNVRIPHVIKNCSLPAFDFLIDDFNMHSTLIISAPGCGKTTFLRDLIFQLANKNVAKNLLIADERNEICCTANGISCFKLGCFCDIYTNCSKEFAFKNGIRSMSPDIIFTDEIDLNKDLKIIVEALNSGVNVVATIHAKDLKQLNNKNNFAEIIDKKLFTRFVVLNSDNGPGTIAQIYDENLSCIYCGC